MRILFNIYFNTKFLMPTYFLIKNEQEFSTLKSKRATHMTKIKSIILEVNSQALTITPKKLILIHHQI